MTKIDKPLIDLHNGRNDSALGFSEVVIRRRNPIELLRGQLLKADGSAIHSDRRDQRVVYSSTLGSTWRPTWLSCGKPRKPVT